MRKYFFAMTPYHLILSYSFAIGSKNNILILLPYFKGKGLISALEDSNTEERVFDDIILLKSYRGKESGISGFLKDLKHRTEIYLHNKNVIDSIPFKNSELFIFNDIIFESQLLMHRNRENNGKNYYVEDGLAAYINRPDPRVPEFLHYSFMLKKIIGRGRFSHIKHHATHPYLDGCFVNHPDIIREDIKLEVKRLPSYHEKLAESSFIERVASYYNLSSLKDRERDICMVFPGNLFEISIIYGIPLAKITDFYLKIIESLKDKVDVMIKFHPRESVDVINRMSMDESIFPVNATVPSEILVTYMGNKVKAIIGDISTTLISSSNITRVPVISTAAILGEHVKKENLKEWDGFIRLMRMFKIKVPSEIPDLVKSIN